VRSVTLRRENAERAASGLLLATDVADYLVRKGMPFRTAHETVGRMVRALLDAGRTFSDLSLEEWRLFCPLFDADVGAAITAHAAVAAKCTPQSTNPDAVGRMLRAMRDWVAAHAPA
jgi:argininosuccinate lyase